MDTCRRKPWRISDSAVVFKKETPCDGEIFTVAWAIMVVPG
jgi:hypothetical protein